MSECKICSLKPDFWRDGAYDKFGSSVELASGGWTSLYAAADPHGRIFLYGQGDGDTDRYYLNYCPECGRKIPFPDDLVQCKDCIFWHKHRAPSVNIDFKCDISDPDDYCSRGIRKKEENP